MPAAFSSWPIGKTLLLGLLPLITTASLCAAYVEHARNEAGLKDKLTAQARSLAAQIMADRQYYATTVVPRISAMGGTLGPDYAQVHGRFPLPATFVRETAEGTAQLNNGYSARLISPWPINKAQGMLDEFHQAGFAYLAQHPEDQFIRTETVAGRQVLRVLMADRALSPSCVSCHNSHPDSPRRDFQLGEVMGGLEIDVPTDRYRQEIRQDLLLTFAGGSVMCLLVMGVVAVGTNRFVTRPLSALAARMADVVSTDPQHPGPGLLRGNEVTALTAEFESMAATIDRQQSELREANASLERRVLERTEQLRMTMAEKERIASELRIASDIQQSILPRTFPPFPHRTDCDIYAESLPAREMGGDFYDFFLIDDHRLGLVIADVSGKGVPAAIFMAVSRTVIKAGAMTGIDPGECLRQANILLCQDNDAAMFVTVFYGWIDLRTGVLVYANAGHNHPYLIRRHEGLLALPSTGGMAVGVIESAVFRANTIALLPGDALFLFTDGITEAMNESSELFGDDRLEACLRQAGPEEPRKLLTAVLAAVRTFVDGAPQSDDITALAFRYHSDTARET